MDYDLIVVKTLERVYKNYYYIIRGYKRSDIGGHGAGSIIEYGKRRKQTAGQRAALSLKGKNKCLQGIVA